jgi:hypothetical protein
MKNRFLKPAFLLFTVLAVLSFSASADRGDRDRRDRGDRKEHKERQEKFYKDYRVDKRYHHNRRYPPAGYSVKVLPERHRPIRYRDTSYFYISGVWYRPSGPRYVVVRPPIGIVVPILPSFYTTVWFHGIPYYYANDAYYVWRPDLNAYQVAEPPEEETQTQPQYMADELFIYPKQGQSEQQQADDRYACHQWGVDQTGYDPTQPPGNLPVSELSQLRQEYQRAMKACLEGRGYSVR